MANTKWTLSKWPGCFNSVPKWQNFAQSGHTWHKYPITDFQMVLMSLTLAPIRIVCLFVLIGLAGILSWIGLIGISDSELSTKPFTGWRRRLQKLLYKVGRWGFFCIGVHRLKVIGERVRYSVWLLWKAGTRWTDMFQSTDTVFRIKHAYIRT